MSRLISGILVPGTRARLRVLHSMIPRGIPSQGHSPNELNKIFDFSHPISFVEPCASGCRFPVVQISVTGDGYLTGKVCLEILDPGNLHGG